MNGTSQQLLESFEQLPESEKHQIAIEILRRTLSLEVPSLAEEELTLSAEALFLSLDREEAEAQGLMWISSRVQTDGRKSKN